MKKSLITKKPLFIGTLMALLILVGFFIIKSGKDPLKNTTSEMNSKIQNFSYEKKKLQQEWAQIKWKLPQLKTIEIKSGSPPAYEWSFQVPPPFQLSSQKNAHHALEILMLVHDEPHQFHIIIQHNLMELPSRNTVEEKFKDYKISKKKK